MYGICFLRLVAEIVAIAAAARSPRVLARSSRVGAEQRKPKEAKVSKEGVAVMKNYQVGRLRDRILLPSKYFTCKISAK